MTSRPAVNLRTVAAAVGSAGAIVAAGLYATHSAPAAANAAVVTASPAQASISAEAPKYDLNDRGQSYGSDLYAASPEQAPDLILAYGDDGTMGYLLKTDLRPTPPRTPEEALAKQAALNGASIKIPLFKSDGVTVIGSFTLGSGLK